MRSIRIEPVSDNYMERAQIRLDSLTKPPGSLGRLEEFARRIVAIRKDENPSIHKKVICVFAGDHGVTDEGVSAFPKEVTAQMVFNFLKGGAAINVLGRHAGAEVAVVDVGVDFDFEGIDGLIHRKVMRGTRNFAKGPAMTREEAEQCIEVGLNLAHRYGDAGYSLFGTGDMGIGNTASSSAITAVITGLAVSKVTGKGTGISDQGLLGKIKVIEEGIERNHPDSMDAIDVLAKVGGTEIGAIAGLILGAAEQRIPVVVDGLISSAGALIAYLLEPAVKGYMFAAHRSVEVGQTAILDWVGLEPVLDLQMRLGEGTGAALAMHLIEGGLRIYKEMATFDEAGVSGEIGE